MPNMITNNNVKILHLSKLEQLENLSIEFGLNFLSTYQPATLVIEMLFAEFAKMKNLKSLEFLSSKLLDASLIWKLISSLDKLPKLQSLSIPATKVIQKPFYNSSPLIFTSNLGTIKLECIPDTKESAQSILQAIGKLQSLSFLQLGLYIDQSQSPTQSQDYDYDLADLLRLNKLRTLILSTNITSLFTRNWFNNIAEMIQRNSKLEVFSLNLLDLSAKHLGREVNSQAVEYELVKPVLEALPSRKAALSEICLNFYVKIEEESEISSFLEDFAYMLRVKYLSFFWTFFLRNLRTDTQARNLMLKLIRNLPKLGNVSNLHLGIETKNLKEGFCNEKLSELYTEFYHLKRLSFGQGLPTSDSFVPKGSGCKIWK